MSTKRKTKTKTPLHRQSESLLISELKPHPKNYRSHPDDQLEHLAESIGKHGFYRSVVVAKDKTILAGHGIVEAAKKMGLETIPVIKLDILPNDPRALKILTGDNQIAHLGVIDDRVLTELLKEIKDTDTTGLLGTGYDDKMLAALLLVTRPASEIKSLDEAKEWAGMPEYDNVPDPFKIHVCFRNEADRRKFMKLIKASVINKKTERVWSLWWPEQKKEDLVAQRFEG